MLPLLTVSLSSARCHCEDVVVSRETEQPRTVTCVRVTGPPLGVMRGAASKDISDERHTQDKSAGSIIGEAEEGAPMLVAQHAHRRLETLTVTLYERWCKCTRNAESRLISPLHTIDMCTVLHTASLGHGPNAKERRGSHQT